MSPDADSGAWLASSLAERAGYGGLWTLDAPAPGDAAMRWAASGLDELTGPTDAPPIQPTRDFATRLDALPRVVRAFATTLGVGLPLDTSVYAERAVDLGLTRRGGVSAGGAARMVRCQGGWAVVNLARPEDLELFEAWIGAPAGDDPWRTLAEAAADLDAEIFAADGRLLGLPVAVVDGGSDEQRTARPEAQQGAPLIRRWGPKADARDPAQLLVVDLSGLWAGPLCGRLFAQIGARVIKVESTARPDGARGGSPAFFERLNAGKACAAFDFATELGRADLRALLQQADVVIESARPRAMQQLGVDPEALARDRPNLVWISLTAYGRTGPWSNAVGFGDDCAAGAGLIVHDEAGDPMFVGDALADPVAGLMAASAGFAVLAAGGGALVDVALREAAGFIAQAPLVDG
jgi:hypothetical protein